MAIFNGYPASYQPMFYPPVQQPYQAQQQAAQNQGQSAVIWVQGEAGAKSYLVAPNSTVQLWDSEAQTIYLKSADASGMPSMKILDYTIREIGQNTPPAAAPARGEAYATKQEVEALTAQITAVKKQLEEIREGGGQK